MADVIKKKYIKEYTVYSRREINVTDSDWQILGLNGNWKLHRHFMKLLVTEFEKSSEKKNECISQDIIIIANKTKARLKTV